MITNVLVKVLKLDLNKNKIKIALEHFGMQQKKKFCFLNVKSNITYKFEFY